MRGRIVFEVVKMFMGMSEVAACPGVVTRILWKKRREGCRGREALKV